MFYQPRNWKWMVPAGLIPLTIIAWNWFMDRGWVDWALLPLCVGGIFLVATVVNLYLYAAGNALQIYTDAQIVKNSTPEVRMFEAARGMHPDAVEALLSHRRTIWRIKYVPFKDVADWILDEAPTVHAGFVDFVLDHSNQSGVMGKHGILSQGSKQFDPDGIIEDRDQYDDLILLMQQKLMCTEALGNQSPRWTPPWNPDLVRHRFGLDGDQYVVEEQSDAMAAIRRAQAKVGIPANGASSSNHPESSEVLIRALDELEQTNEMKLRTSQLTK